MCMAYADAWERQCAGKRPYKRSRDAKRDCRHVMAAVGGRAMVVYRCGWCSSWHFGHPSPFKLARARRALLALEAV